MLTRRFCFGYETNTARRCRTHSFRFGFVEKKIKPFQGLRRHRRRRRHRLRVKRARARLGPFRSSNSAGYYTRVTTIRRKAKG